MDAICPIRMVSLAILASAITQASIAYPKNADRLQDVLSKDDKLCNMRGCAMWNKRRKCCGLINT